MIEIVLCKICGSQFVEKKNRNRCGEEIDARVILLRLSNKLILKRIGHQKSEIRPPNYIYSYPECVLEYIGHLASRNIVGEIWEGAYKVSFADFWNSVDLPHLKIVDSHKLYKVTIFIIIIISTFDSLQETATYQWKTSYKKNFEK